MKELAASIFVSTRNASTEVREGLQSIRQHIRRLNDQIDAVKAIPPVLETAIARMESYVDGKADFARSQVPRVAEFMDVSMYDGPRMEKVEYFAMAYLAPLIKQCMADQLKAAYATVKGISDDDRERQLEKLGVELLDAELVEESIIRDAERAGFQLSRRAKADPRAVLAADKDLP
ncbi:hypothetical protein GFL95_14270 [Rhizobium leguminosarum bv. viciae]|uniref:hypothetical protein n=1 Tax=Rhizobium leguminosarum TaxID=384 RepID=UPI0014418D9E|nr:hypothetical protein [Rhizobium leguminosarum]NKK92381.1 hypothetical protein [Rhizobium leguminosarum bv. viciae]